MQLKSSKGWNLVNVKCNNHYSVQNDECELSAEVQQRLEPSKC